MTERLMIDIGDEVLIHYTDSRGQMATVIHIPQGEGDTYQFQGVDGHVFILNVYASTVERIETRLPKGKQ
jgi:hypothetical protein